MKYFTYLLVVVVLLGLNIGLFGSMRIYNQIPNLLLLFVIFASLEKKSGEFLYIILICGAALDFYSTGFFGGYTLGFLLTGLIINLLSENFLFADFGWKTLSGLLLGALLLLKITLWLYGFMALKFNWTRVAYRMDLNFYHLVAEYIYNWVLLYPIFMAHGFLKKAINNYYIHKRGVVH